MPKAKVIPFPSDVIEVELTPEERQYLDHAKKKYGKKSDSGAFKAALRDVAKEMRINVTKPRKR